MIIVQQFLLLHSLQVLLYSQVIGSIRDSCKELYSNHQVRLEEGEVSHEISIIFLSQKMSVILDFSLDCSGKGLSVSCITGTDELQKLSYFSLFKFKLVCHL